MIDGGSCVNIIAKSVIERMNLKAEPLTQPYNITWVEKIAQSITLKCLMPIQLLSYHDRTWSEVLTMDTANILLGRS